MQNVLHWSMNYSSSNGGEVQPWMYYLLYSDSFILSLNTADGAFLPDTGTVVGHKQDGHSFPGQACDHVPTSNVTSTLREPGVLRTNRPFKCFHSCPSPYCLQAVNSNRCCQLTVPSVNIRVGEGFAAVSSANNTDASSIYT